jgi:hypothetical protein
MADDLFNVKLIAILNNAKLLLRVLARSLFAE